MVVTDAMPLITDVVSGATRRPTDHPDPSGAKFAGWWARSHSHAKLFQWEVVTLADGRATSLRQAAGNPDAAVLWYPLLKLLCCPNEDGTRVAMMTCVEGWNDTELVGSEIAGAILGVSRVMVSRWQQAGELMAAEGTAASGFKYRVADVRALYRKRLEGK